MTGEPPAISAILYTPSDFEVIRKVVRHLRAQSIHNSIELVIACPRPASLNLDEPLLRDFAGCQVVGVDAAEQFAARAEAIRSARAPIVSLQEEHAFPGEGWGEAMLAAFARGYDAVGPTMYNANPRSLLSEATFILLHSYALPSDHGEQATMISENNAAFRREILVCHYGDKLAWWLDRPHDLQKDMLRRGYRLCQSEAPVYHLNLSTWRHAAVSRFCSGRLYGTRRSAGWSRSRRALYSLGAPLIPLARVAHNLSLIRYALRRGSRLYRLLPGMLAVEIATGVGEVVGYLRGAGRALEQRNQYEVGRAKFLKASEQRALHSDDLTLPIRG
jgi:hypothetical protein